MSVTDGDLRWVAVLSADMMDFTKIAHEIGAEQAFALIRDVLARAETRITEQGGTVIDTAGDGLLATFGAPLAQEVPSVAACIAAEDFLADLTDHTSDLETRFGVRPTFRLGIAGGNCMVARLPEGGTKIVGDAVNEAARIQAQALPNQIVLSEAIRIEAAQAITTADLGEVSLKGFSDPVQMHALNAVRRDATRFEASQNANALAPIVGRNAELKEAIAALNSSPQNTVLITGPAGIGKSRLAHAAIAHLSVSHDALIGQCTQTGPAAAFAPILDMLRQAAGLPWGASTSDVITSLISQNPDLADRTAADAFLAPIAQDRDQTTNALKAREFLTDLLAALVNTRRALLVVEDVHWIDSSTNAVLAALVDLGVPMIATSRPGFRADWFVNANVCRIDLGTLETADIQSIAATQLGGMPDEQLATLISEKAEGFPLIAQEVARALQQSGRVTRDSDRVLLTDASGPVLTGNLEQLVLSRIDGLDAAQKTALQTASAIGRDFDADLLKETLQRDAGLEHIAETPGLIDNIGSRQWRFSHALIRDAVYASILSLQKQELHGAIAQALLHETPPRPGSDALIADHFLRSATPDLSVPHLIRAAAESLSVYAVYDVDERCERAMEFLEIDPSLADEESFRDLAVTWLRALDQIGDFHRIEKIGARVLPRLERSGYSVALSIVRTLTSIGMTHVRDYRGAQALSERTRDEALKEGDAWGAAWAKIPMMRTFDETGWADEAAIEKLAKEITPVAEETGDRHLAMNALYLTSSGLRSAGYRSRALDVAQDIKRFSKTHQDRRSMGFALWAEALIYAVDNAPERVAETVQEARTHVIPGSADERVCLGLELFADTFLSAPDALRPRVQHLIDEAKGLGDYNISNSMEFTLILLELKAGNLALGWKLLTDLINEVEWTGHASFQRQGHITRAEILLSIAKLIDPASEAPPDRKTFPQKKPGFSDLMLFLSLKVRAKRLATTALKRVESLCPSKRGPFYSRSQTGLGLIAASKGDRASAIPLLEAGLKAAEEEDLRILRLRAQRALDRLGS